MMLGIGLQTRPWRVQMTLLLLLLLTFTGNLFLLYIFLYKAAIKHTAQSGIHMLYDVGHKLKLFALILLHTESLMHAIL